MRRLRELPGFVRINICLYAASLAAIGYLLYNRPDQTLAYVMLSAFLGCAGAYAYNNITDVREDLINRKKLNYFADKPAGKAIVALCTIAGLSFALMLSPASLLVYLSFMSLGFTYSCFRIKKHFLLKNVWTSFSLSQSLLFGAFAVSVTPAVISAYAVVFLLMLAGSIIADMRDVEGDIRTGISTLPAKVGMTHSARIVYALFCAIPAFVLMFKIKAFYIVPVFLAGAAFLVAKNRFQDAHRMGGASLVALFLWLLASEVL